MTETNRDIEELKSRSAIQSLAARYILAADRRNFEDFANCFSEDATFVAGPGGALNGRANILQFMQGAPPDLPKVRHHTTTHHIEFTGPDSASGVQYFQTVSEIGPDNWGVYEDEYRLIDGQWLIQVRNGVVEGNAPNSIIYGSN